MLVSAVGEDICLGFANTLTWRGSAAPVETLADFAALLAWAETSAALPPPAGRELARWGDEHPLKAAEVFAEAIVLREAIYRIASALACGEPVCGRGLCRVGPRRVASPGAPAARARKHRLCLADRARESRPCRHYGSNPAGAGAVVGGRSRGRGARAGAFAAAPTMRACGCSSTRARTARGAGATWPPAATAPRRAGTISRSSRVELGAHAQADEARACGRP